EVPQRARGRRRGNGALRAARRERGAELPVEPAAARGRARWGPVGDERKPASLRGLRGEMPQQAGEGEPARLRRVGADLTRTGRDCDESRRGVLEGGVQALAGV